MSDDARLTPLAAVRVTPAQGNAVRVFSGPCAWAIEGRTRFHAGPAAPSALDALLGALGADLVLGFTALLRREGVPVRQCEVALSAQVDNALVPLGVVGEEGSPALSAIVGTVYVSSDASQETLRALWERAAAASSVCATLRRATPVTIVVQLVP